MPLVMAAATFTAKYQVPGNTGSNPIKKTRKSLALNIQRVWLLGIHILVLKTRETEEGGWGGKGKWGRGRRVNWGQDVIYDKKINDRMSKGSVGIHHTVPWGMGTRCKMQEKAPDSQRQPRWVWCRCQSGLNLTRQQKSPEGWPVDSVRTVGWKYEE